MKIFAFLRYIFASDRAFESLWAAFSDIIQRVYIPKLQIILEKTPSDERGKIYQLIEEYRKSADMKTSEGRRLKEMGRKIMFYKASKYPLSGVSLEEVVQYIAVEFYNNPSLIKVLEKFNPMDGVIKLRNYWSSVLSLYSGNILKKMKNQIIKREKVREDEDSGKDTIQNIRFNPQTDVSGLIRRMGEFFYDNLNKVESKPYIAKVAREIFEIWHTAVTRNHNLDYGLTEPGIKRLWEIRRRKEGETFSRSLFYNGVKAISDVLKLFFIEEKKYKFSSGKTIAERIANSEFRVLFAKWILGE